MKKKPQPPIVKIPVVDSFYKGIKLDFKVPQLVKILWVDAYTVGGAEWMEKDKSQEIAREPLPHMLTVGFVLYTDSEQIAVTNTIGSDETAQVWKIPKRMVISTVTL